MTMETILEKLADLNIELDLLEESVTLLDTSLNELQDFNYHFSDATGNNTTVLRTLDAVRHTYRKLLAEYQEQLLQDCLLA